MHPVERVHLHLMEAEEENALETTVFFGEKYKTGKILFGPKRNNNKHSYM